MCKIVAFGGRIASGKSELAKICEESGFKRLYFALPLKQLIADLIGVKLEEINGLKNVEKDYIFDDDDYLLLSKETGISFDLINEEMSKVKFKTVRQLLQFIGTDLIRKYNTNWHVNKIREIIKNDKDANYVIDDVRFKNELDLIKELGGICWFIIRPNINNISNHESETTLSWRDFGNKIIINDSGLKLFKYRWKTFFNSYDKSNIVRDKILKTDSIIKLYGDISEPLSVLELLEISTYLFNYKERTFDCSAIKKVIQNEDKSVDIEYDDNSHEIVKNPINIEDLKFCL